MANRVITADVRGEYIKLSSRIAGAAGAFNAVSLELTFDENWDGTTKKLYFYDADGGNAVCILLTTNLLKPGSGEVYVVPIPAEPLAVAGKLKLNIRGIETGASDTAERVMVAAETQMDVLPASIPTSDTAPVEPTPTQAEQLQAEIDEIKSDIVEAAKAADAVQAATDAAQSAASAKEAAQAAQTAAEAAKTGALTAKTAAEAAETGANQARLMAQAHSADAAISEANAKAWAEGGELQGMSTSMEGEVVPGAKYYSEAAAGSATTAKTAEQGAESAKTSAESSATASANSASAAASSALSASSSATVASGKASDAEAAAAAAAAASTAAQTAKTGAESAKSSAETARAAAETAQGASASSATAAAGSATEAAQSADAAEAAQTGAESAASAAEASETAAEGYASEAQTAKTAAQTAQAAAEAAQDAIENMSVEATTLPAGANATVAKTVDATGNVKLTYGIPQGIQGPQGPAGEGSGDMLATTYDPQGKEQDVFAYVDDAVANIPAPESEIFWVTLTHHDTPDIDVADKTLAEITEAHNAGKYVILRDSNGDPYPLLTTAEWVAAFGGVGMNGQIYTVDVTANGNVNWYDFEGLSIEGGTMTGALTLSGAPTENLHAATKQYVDDAVANIPTPDISGKADKAVPSAANNVALLDASGNLADSGKSIDSLGGIPIVTTEGTGAAYTATVPRITSLTRGACFIMVPHAQSTSKTPTLDVNNLGAKEIRRAQSAASNYLAGGKAEGWLGAYQPILVVYSGGYWIVQNMTQPFATDLQGEVSIFNGGTGASTASAARENLGITPAAIGAVPLAGGTMTGNLIFDVNSQIQFNAGGVLQGGGFYGSDGLMYGAVLADNIIIATEDNGPTVPKVRNSSLNAAETTPTVNGAIAWTYA